jgi:sodium-dependent phosphate transporter
MGLMEGSSGLNWRLSVQFFLGWLVTLLLTGLLSAALFSAGAYAPCIQQSRSLHAYEDALLDLTSRWVLTGVRRAAVCVFKY